MYGSTQRISGGQNLASIFRVLLIGVAVDSILIITIWIIKQPANTWPVIAMMMGWAVLQVGEVVTDRNKNGAAKVGRQLQKSIELHKKNKHKIIRNPRKKNRLSNRLTYFLGWLISWNFQLR